MSDPTTKPCLRCGETKPLDAFYRQKPGLYGRQSQCISCRKVRLSELRQAKPHQYAAADIIHSRQHAEWKRNHPDAVRRIDERFREHHRESRSRASLEWAARNPGKAYERHHRYRARKRAAYVAPVDRRAIYARDNGTCQICGLPVSLRAMHLDHIIPISRGGTHEPKNVQVAHVTCNTSKGAKNLR